MSALVDQLAAVLLERGPLPACEIATSIRRRKADVLEALHADARFIQTGRRRASRWSVREAVDASAVFHAALDGVTWPPDFEEAEEALVTLIRQRRHTPEDALLRLVSAWAAA